MTNPEHAPQLNRLPIEIRNPLEITILKSFGVTHDNANEWMTLYNQKMSEILNTNAEVQELALQNNLPAAAEIVKQLLIEEFGDEIDYGH